MKKKLITLALSLTLLITACGSAASPASATNLPSQTSDLSEETKEAQSQIGETVESAAPSSEGAVDETAASKETVPPLTGDSIGAVSFIPDGTSYQFIYGNTVIQAYFQREGVIAGEGKVQIRKTSDNSVAEELDLQKEGVFETADADSYVERLGWSGGTHVFFHLDKVLEAGETYYLTADEGAFISSDGSIRSKAISDASICSFTVTNYGVMPQTPSGSDVFVGDVLNADIYLYQPAVVAKIENYDENRVRFNEKVFEASGKLEIKIHQIGEDPFTVNFYDAEDNLLGSASLSYTASLRPEETESLPKATIGNL